MQFPITIGLHRSRILDAGIFLVALSATAATLFFPQSTAVQWGIIVALWGFAAFAWYRASPVLRRIRLELDGSILIASANQDAFYPVLLLPGATVHHWLTVVRLQTSPGQILTLIVTVDNLSNEDFRHLRLFLRWLGDFSGEAGDA